MNRKRRNLNPFCPADANGLSKSLKPAQNLLCYHSKYIWIMSPIFISQHDIKIEILQITVVALKRFSSMMQISFSLDIGFEHLLQK